MKALAFEAQALLDDYASWHFARDAPHIQRRYTPVALTQMSERCESFTYQEDNDQKDFVTPSNMLISGPPTLLSEWIRDIHLVAAITYSQEPVRNYDLEFRFTHGEAKMVAFGGNKGRVIPDAPWRPSFSDRR